MKTYESLEALRTYRPKASYMLGEGYVRTVGTAYLFSAIETWFRKGQ